MENFDSDWWPWLSRFRIIEKGGNYCKLSFIEFDRKYKIKPKGKVRSIKTLEHIIETIGQCIESLKRDQVTR